MSVAGPVPPPGRLRTVLVVEDELPVREVLSRTLAEAGYQVLEASNGLDALQLFEGRECGVDVVITDLRMPQMGGRELAARLAERGPVPPILFMSGFNSPRTAGSLPGPVFQKPFENDRLLAQLSQLLGG
jgi:two-component system cell cycle sensor histidine kinase/response regulator CckA